MQIINAVAQLQAVISGWKQRGLRIGFVPTMGNLHQGHLSLVEGAKSSCDKVVVSIFVNPLQFDEEADLKAYPRTLEQDLEKLTSAAVDLVFVPSEYDLYPEGRENITRVEVPGLSDILEGASRPGHFSGVTTVVTKLFHCVQPDKAFFGEKDFQQLRLIQRMVSDLNFPLEVVSMPTCREDDGLAMSSRNRRLSVAERQLAPSLYQVLTETAQKITSQVTDFQALSKQAEKNIEKQGFMVDYVSIRLGYDLSIPKSSVTQNGQPYQKGELVILAAVRLGEIRLIDNIRV